MTSLPETKVVDTVKLYRNLTCASCGKKMTKSIKPQGEAKCRPCLQPNAKVRELTCKHCKNTFKSIVQADYCSNLCHSRDYDRVGFNCIECGVGVVRHSVRCRPCSAAEQSRRGKSTELVLLTPEAKRIQALSRMIGKAKVAKSNQFKRIVNASCVVCSNYFNTRGTDITCNAVCQLVHKRASRDSHDYKRRMLIKSAFVAPVYRKKIYERDNWTCRICREPVDREAKVPNLKAPTIDHVIPLSWGGEHKPGNVRLTCFRCNSLRGNKVGIWIIVLKAYDKDYLEMQEHFADVEHINGM